MHIYYYLGQPERGIDLIQTSNNIVETIPQSPMFDSMNYLYLALCHLDLKDRSNVEKNIAKIENLHRENENEIIWQHLMIAKALYAKSDSRILKQAEAMEILKNIVDGKIIDFLLMRLAMVNLADILLDEFASTGNDESLSELREIISTLYPVAQDQENEPVVQTYL